MGRSPGDEGRAQAKERGLELFPLWCPRKYDPAWFRISRFWNPKIVSILCLGHPICGPLLRQPGEHGPYVIPELRAA